MAVTGISTKLLYHLQRNAGRDVTVNELMESMPEYSRNQIMANVRNLMQTEAGKAIRLVKTAVWNYTGKDDGRTVTFTVLKETDSMLLLESENGGIYRAEYLG